MTSSARLRNKSLLFMIIDIDDLNFMGEESSSRLQTQYGRCSIYCRSSIKEKMIRISDDTTKANRIYAYFDRQNKKSPLGTKYPRGGFILMFHSKEVFSSLS